MKGLAAGVPAIVVLAGMAAAGALLLASVLRYPVMIRQPGAGAVLALTVAALLGYAAYRSVITYGATAPLVPILTAVALGPTGTRYLNSHG